MVNWLRAAYRLYRLKRHLNWSRSKLIKHQTKRLRRILTYAYDKVPFWHSKLKEYRIKPSDIKTLNDLNKVPIITKDLIKREASQMISVDYNKNILKPILTSGSSGKPLTVYINTIEDEIRKARHLRANMVCGQKMRDRWITITSPYRFQEIPGLAKLFRIYMMNTISVYDPPVEQLASVEEMQPDVLEGYSSSLFLLAKEADRRGGESIRPRIMFSGAELIDASQRSHIRKVFDAPLYDQYATVEFERMAWQCPKAVGYHIDADALIMQFIDKEGNEVSHGERGEIVCTSLFNYAMPLIRYAVGDVGLSSSEECPCGISFPLMKMIEGRKDSILYLPDGRPISPIAFIYAMQDFSLFKYVAQWRVVQKTKDSINVYIKKTSETIDEQSLQVELVNHLSEVLQLGSETTVEVDFVKNITLDKSGKLPKVVSQWKAQLVE